MLTRHTAAGHRGLRVVRACRTSCLQAYGLRTQHPVAPRRSSRKTINHPHVGPLTLDCDTLEVRDSDLRLIYTAPQARQPPARSS
ncbi:MAG: hypothetical protein ABR992_10350 [Solirubrobacteraceae bacterium]